MTPGSSFPSYARYLRRFGWKNAAWFGDYCRFREVGLLMRGLRGREIGSLLDVGCAGTLFPYYAAAALPDTRLIGIDNEANQALAADRMMQVAKRRPESKRVTIFSADARDLPFADASFDAATAISAIEHISADGDIAAVREMARVVRPGGNIVLTVPMSAAHEELESDPSSTYFIRRYDKRSLAERLIDPIEPGSTHIRYFAEGRFPFSRHYLRLRSIQGRLVQQGPVWKPLRYLGWLALLLTPVASRTFLRSWEPGECEDRIPGGAVVHLEKSG